MDLIICKSCGEKKEVFEFYASNRTCCKLCVRKRVKERYCDKREEMLAKAKQYHQEHREENSQYQKNWYRENKNKMAKLAAQRYREKKGQIQSYLKKYYIENQEEIKSKTRRYYYQNKEKVIDYQREYAKVNREKVSLYKSKYRANHRIQRREAGKIREEQCKANGGNIVLSEWNTLLEQYGNKCLACGSTENPSMDHIIPLSKGGRHSIDNVQPLCVSCNSRKGTKTIDYRVDNFEYT